MSPFLALFGRSPRLLGTPMTTELEARHDPTATIRKIRGNLENARRKQAEHYKRARRQLMFSEGDCVWVDNDDPNGKTGRIGPYRVTQQTSPVTYRLRDQKGRDTSRHVSKMTRYYGSSFLEKGGCKVEPKGTPGIPGIRESFRY